MFHRLAADAVLLLHLAFILFVLLGGLLALRWRWAPLAHLPAAAWGVFIELSGGLCPLTPLENRLRAAAGQAGYEGGFVAHYLLPVIYPAGLTHDMQFVLAFVVAAVNAAAYAWVWRRRSRRARMGARSNGR
ncbi:MAG: DUF2784 domain-containing protein [Betaproteobacteria bacterium]|nr:MAG: DUF2784 domain-containing protein [Betaproteobacteria bacterium]